MLRTSRLKHLAKVAVPNSLHSDRVLLTERFALHLNLMVNCLPECFEVSLDDKTGQRELVEVQPHAERLEPENKYEASALLFSHSHGCPEKVTTRPLQPSQPTHFFPRHSPEVVRQTWLCGNGWPARFHGPTSILGGCGPHKPAG
jgi:hypothetical protein